MGRLRSDKLRPSSRYLAVRGACPGSRRSLSLQAAFGCPTTFGCAALGRRASMAIKARSPRTASRWRAVEPRASVFERLPGCARKETAPQRVGIAQNGTGNGSEPAGGPNRGETPPQAAFGWAGALDSAAAFGRRASMAISARSARTASRWRALSQAQASSIV
jgi:hypothetical protein